MITLGVVNYIHFVSLKMLSLIEVEWSVIIEKHLGPLRAKFNTKQTRINLSEVESKFIAIRHVKRMDETKKTLLTADSDPLARQAGPIDLARPLTRAAPLLRRHCLVVEIKTRAV